MISIEFINSGFLRLKPNPIKDLSPSEVWTVPKGMTVVVKAYKQDLGLFLRVTFDRVFNGRWMIGGAIGEDLPVRRFSPILMSVAMGRDGVTGFDH